MIWKCDFCKTTHLLVTRYKCTGTNFGERVEKTIKMCTCCNANTDEQWLADKLGWDNVTEVEIV